MKSHYNQEKWNQGKGAKTKPALFKGYTAIKKEKSRYLNPDYNMLESKYSENNTEFY